MGHQSASTVVSAIDARSVVGLQSASTVVGALGARSAVGHKYASTAVSAIDARSVAPIAKVIPSNSPLSRLSTTVQPSLLNRPRSRLPVRRPSLRQRPVRR